jgi:hypothetical protein
MTLFIYFHFPLSRSHTPLIPHNIKSFQRGFTKRVAFMKVFPAMDSVLLHSCAGYDVTEAGRERVLQASPGPLHHGQSRDLIPLLMEVLHPDAPPPPRQISY